MKKQTNTIIGIVSVIAIAGLLGYARLNSSRTPLAAGTINSALEPSVLSAAESSYDFGTISMAKGIVSHKFSVKNTGTDPVTVKSMYTSCMCTSASLWADGKTYGPFGMPGHGTMPSINASILPGQEVEVDVFFDPAAHGPAGVGKIERAIYLESPGMEPFTLTFTANVTP